MEDERIISLFFARDEAAIEGCRAKYGAYLRRVAENVTGSALDAEECEADAYEAVWRRIPPENSRTGLFRASSGSSLRIKPVSSSAV